MGRMANLITLSRLLLLSVVVVGIYYLPPVLQTLNVLVLILVFATDGFDGYVARKRNETSRFGAMFDIASDRIVELTLWIVFFDLELVALWVPLVFIFRGTIVDAIRSTQAAQQRRDPFSMLNSRIGRILVAGIYMRVFYAVLKAVTFCWLLLSLAFPAIAPEFWALWSEEVAAISGVLVISSAAICILRGLPVVFEFLYAERHSLLGSLAGRG